MKIRKIIIVFLSFYVSAVTAQKIVTVSEAIELALENNYGIKIISNTKKIAKNNASLLNSGYLPTVTSTSGATFNKDNIEAEFANGETTQLNGAKSSRYNASINLNYTLFDGLGRYYNYKRLKETYKLVTSVKGIGMQTAIMIIVFTDNFSKFENWRKFASYCGVAPFPYQSGTSIKGRTKVSHLANKKLKAIINMCAISAIQHNPEMKLYYHKRIEQGKSKMSTVNIIRNKLIARVFAVVKRQTPYVDTFKFAA